VKLDTFVQLIKDLRRNQELDDTDPNNTILQVFSTPYDQVSVSESIKFTNKSPGSFVWGNGSTYTSYDSNNNPYQAPSCGWYWGSGGRYQ
jgi:hypothetical protein